MNYARHYDLLIARARQRRLSGYRERHHVLPKCMGGTNQRSNIVELTPEEHFVAHQLLVKIHPGIKFLAAAASFMAKKTGRNKAYGWLRRVHATNMREAMLGNEYTRGIKQRPRAPEWRAALSAANRGKPKSLPHRKALAASAVGKKVSAVTRAKLSKAHAGQVAWNKGVPHTDQARARMSAAKVGNISFTGKTFTDTHREKLSASLVGNTRRRGKTMSPEARAKISASLKGNTNRRRYLAGQCNV